MEKDSPPGRLWASVWFGVDLIYYGISNVSNLTLTLVDPLLELVRRGITGAIIAAVLARIARPEVREQART